MKRSQRIEKIREFTGNKEQEAARVLGECQQRLQQQKQRLADLEMYYEQYSVQITTAGSGGLTIERYQNMQAFLANLNQAIGQQKVVIEQVHLEFERKKQTWLEVRNRNRALGSVAERYRQQEDARDEKRLQTEINDRYAKPGGGKN